LIVHWRVSPGSERPDKAAIPSSSVDGVADYCRYRRCEAVRHSWAIAIVWTDGGACGIEPS
jgi:hypothetical protein